MSLTFKQGTKFYFLAFGIVFPGASERIWGREGRPGEPFVNVNSGPTFTWRLAAVSAVSDALSWSALLKK